MDIEQYVFPSTILCPSLTARRFRKAGYQVIDRICEYYYSLEEQPVASRVEPGYLERSVPRKTRLCRSINEKLRNNR